MQLCNNCPRKCGVNRNAELGVCGVGNVLKIARAGLHFGEEPCITGKNGSGTIFFSGCSLKCVMCQNYNISHEAFGKEVSEDRFVNIIKELEAKGAHNINMVTPGHYFRQISSAIDKYRPNIPIIANTGGYDSVEMIKSNLFDVYLFDLKYFSREKSMKYSKCSDYFDIASKAIIEAVKQKGKPVFNGEGIIQSGVIVRHLILPQSTNDSIEIIKWLHNNVPEVVFSLMSQYVPMYKATEYPEINRRITKREYEKVLDFCYDKNFFDIYIQDRSSSTKELIPLFDLSGV